MINYDNAPKVAGDTPDFKSTVGSLKDLKDTNQGYSGYGVSDEEIVVFPTEAQLNEAIAAGKDAIRIKKKSRTSNNKTALILAERIKNGRSITDWFNMSRLADQARTATGDRFYPTDFMAEMASLPDDYERFKVVAGKAIKGNGITHAFTQKFDRDTRKPLEGQYDKRDYVNVELCEVPATANVDNQPEPVVEEPKSDKPKK